MTLFGLPLRKFPLHLLGLDELGGILRRETSEFCALGSKERCAGTGVAGVATGVEGAHPVLVSTRVLRPVLARQERQAFGAVTLTCCGSLGARGCDSLVSLTHSGIGLCSPFCGLCSPFG